MLPPLRWPRLDGLPQCAVHGSRPLSWKCSLPSGFIVSSSFVDPPCLPAVPAKDVYQECSTVTSVTSDHTYRPLLRIVRFNEVGWFRHIHIAFNLDFTIFEVSYYVSKSILDQHWSRPSQGHFASSWKLRVDPDSGYEDLVIHRRDIAAKVYVSLSRTT